MTYSEIWHRIATSYDDGEARAIARILIEELFGLSYTDIVCGATEQLSADDTLRLDTAVRRIEQGEPLQHVLGYADFCGNRFCVNGSVLIPRPETEWLVDEGAKLMDGCIASDETQHKAPHSPKRILDIGTGSGCIAISLKLRLGDAYVEAWDISEEALRTAQDNADALKAEVVFRKRDALVSSAPTEQAMDSINYSEANILAAPWDLIVSNPPYICDSERSAMDDNVLLHEPHTALFVPDDDPLRFYRAIARAGRRTLRPGGRLYFEIYERFAEAMRRMLGEEGYTDTEVREDLNGKPRMTCSRLK